MAISDLFKSDSTRKREELRAQHQLERDARKEIKKLDDCIRDQEKQRQELWAKALQFMKVGQKTEAARLVQQHKLLGVEVNRLTKQRLVMQTKLTQVATAGSVGKIVKSIKDFAQSQNVDPIGLSEDLDQIDEVTDSADDINEVIDEAYAKDCEKAAVAAEKNSTSNIDDEMKALEAEAARLVSGEAVPSTVDLPQATASEDINDGLNKINERLAKL